MVDQPRHPLRNFQLSKPILREYACICLIFWLERMFPTRIPGIVIINNGLSHFLRKYVVTNRYEHTLVYNARIWYICTH